MTILSFCCFSVANAQTPQFQNFNIPVEVFGTSKPDYSVLSVDRTKKKDVVPGAFGQGYNSVTGEFLPKVCVKITSLVPKGGAVPTPEGNSAIYEVQSLSEVQSSSRIAGGASLLYSGFSLSAGGSVLNGEYHNSYGRYTSTYQKIVTNEFQGRGEGPNGDPEPTGSALKDIKNIEVFRAICGDSYVSGYILGGTYNVTGGVKATVDKDWKQNETNVSLGFKDILGANFSSSSSYAAMKSASSFDVRNLSVGVTFEKPVTFENMYEIAQNFPNLVKSNPGVVTFVFTPYQTLGAEFKKLPDFSFVRSVKLDELARKRDAARTISNDLIVAQDAANKGFSYFTLDMKPGDARDEIDDYFTKIGLAVVACRKATKENDCVDAINDVKQVPPNHVKRAP